jgi:two-component system sensor histidine kinase RegB
MKLFPSSARQHVNYWRLFMLRNVVTGGLILAVAWMHFGLGLALPLIPVSIIVGALIVFNVLTGWRAGKAWPVSDAEFFVQLLVDIAALTALLFYTGGSANPFVSLYLLPLIIAATVLRQGYAWAIAVLTASLYTASMFIAEPLPVQHGWAGHFNVHLAGMWMNFMLSGTVIALFVARMARTIRERDRLIADFRAQGLRNERIVTLGAFAAGAAHELGTPLSTIAVISKEMERYCGDTPELEEDLRCLRSQVDVCKHILSGLLESSSHARAEQAAALPIVPFVNETLERWRLMRPSIPVSLRWNGATPGPTIVTNPCLLSQAMLNLLNNAADFSSAGVEVEGSWDSDRLTLDIRDRGPGITPEVQQRAGEPFLTTKAPGEGFGLGLFLSNATVERLGGKVQLFNRRGGGACTRVTLPLGAAA